MLIHRLALTMLLGLGLTFSAVAQETTPDEPMLDKIVMKDGSVVLGTVTASRDGVVTLDTNFAGTLSIAIDQILTLQTYGSMSLQVADGNIFRDRPIRFEDDKLTVTDNNGDQLSYTVDQILLVNPEPWELGEGFNWTGSMSFAWVSERGNSDTDELDYKLESIWERVEDRFTLRMDGEIDEANDQQNADNWTVLGKYDYFLDGPWYVGVNISAEADEFADLDLRYYLGPYVGRKFYDEPIFSLEGELGLAYVSEDFISAEDQDYVGANWSVKLASNYLGGDSRLYIDHIGIWNLDRTEDIILNTTFGLAFPLLGRLEGAAEILYEYDSGAVEGIEDLDQTYRLRVGYTW